MGIKSQYRTLIILLISLKAISLKGWLFVYQTEADVLLLHNMLSKIPPSSISLNIISSIIKM